MKVSNSTTQIHGSKIKSIEVKSKHKSTAIYTATGTISTVQYYSTTAIYTASIYKVYRKGTALQATGIACFQYKYILRI